MNGKQLKTLLAERRAGFNDQLVSINDELAALGARARELERILLLIMGQKNEDDFLLRSLGNGHEDTTNNKGGTPNGNDSFNP